MEALFGLGFGVLLLGSVVETLLYFFATPLLGRLAFIPMGGIILPVRDAKRGQGSNLDYHVQRFASVRLLDYKLTGQGYLTFTYKGEATATTVPRRHCRKRCKPTKTQRCRSP